MTKTPIIKNNYSPLRYPGGKGKLSSYIKKIIAQNKLYDTEYVEPYAGGAAVAIELLVEQYVLTAHINDVSRPIYAFWKSVLEDTESLCRLISSTRVCVKNWDRQKYVLKNPDKHNDLELGFAAFFLNRCNRSGILNGGIIGGRAQTGEWGITARFNKKNLIDRIRLVADLGDRITLTNIDAAELVKSNSKKWGKDHFIYLDPPYFNKGQHLYYDFYEESDHKNLAKILLGKKNMNWIISYDNHKKIRSMYSGLQNATYDIKYSARSQSTGREIMVFSPALDAPTASRNMHKFRRRAA